MADKKSLSETVYEELKRRIVSSEYPPGHPLTELALADELKASRTPIRIALRMLEREGLVDFTPNKGSYVKDISLKDIEEVFTLRELMEGYCARAATELLAEESLNYMDSKLEESMDLFDKGEYKAASQCATEIHNVIIGVVGNSRIKSLLENAEQDIGRIHKLTEQIPEKILKSHQEHKHIVEALRTKDGDLAERAMKEHIRSVKKDAIFEIVKKQM